MSKSTYKELTAKKTKRTPPKWNFPLQRENFYIIGAGLIFIIIGYLLMATGISDEPALPDGKWNNPWAIIIAPFLLIIGYCIIIPLGIMKRFDQKKDETTKLQ